MDMDDIDIYLQKQQSDYTTQSSQVPNGSAAAITPYIHRLDGSGTHSITTGIYAAYLAPYNNQLLSIIDQHTYERSLEYINNELLVNYPCFACNVLAYITVPLTLGTSILCINQLCYKNVINALNNAIAQCNTAGGSGDKYAGIKYKWVLHRSTFDSYITIQPLSCYYRNHTTYPVH